MFLPVKKYIKSLATGKTWIVLLFLLLPGLLFAQAGETIDTVPVLRYGIDTTTIPVGEDAEEDSISMITEYEDEKDNIEYFLRREFTGGFSDTLKFRKLPDSVIQRFENDDAFWYANAAFKKKQPKPRKSGGFLSSTLFETILWLVIIGSFAAFLMIYLHNSNTGLFRKTRNIEPEPEGDPATAGIFDINYRKEIEKAVQKGDYRLGVRLMYLQSLKQLADRNIIQYKQDNTNFDYLLQLQPTNMYPDFFRITRNYEYSWYGQFEIDREKFAIIKQDFEHFDRKLY